MLNYWVIIETFMYISSKKKILNKIGAALFILGVVAALVIIIHPFTVNKGSFLRDIIFFIVACVWIGFAFQDEIFKRIESYGKV